MVPMAFALPVLPGKHAALREFAAALKGERSAEYNEAQATVAREAWFLQSTPIGDFVICEFQSPDPMVVLGNLAIADDPFAQWFKAQISDITGVDFGNPSASLNVEPIFDWAKPE